jgi:hypothetical protein
VRKKFDGVKYVQKRLEQVIYELSVRGTVGGPQEQEEVAEGGEELVVAGAEFLTLREKMESFDAARDKVPLAREYFVFHSAKLLLRLLKLSFDSW